MRYIYVYLLHLRNNNAKQFSIIHMQAFHISVLVLLAGLKSCWWLKIGDMFGETSLKLLMSWAPYESQAISRSMLVGAPSFRYQVMYPILGNSRLWYLEHLTHWTLKKNVTRIHVIKLRSTNPIIITNTISKSHHFSKTKHKYEYALC